MLSVALFFGHTFAFQKSVYHRRCTRLATNAFLQTLLTTHRYEPLATRRALAGLLIRPQRTIRDRQHTVRGLQVLSLPDTIIRFTEKNPALKCNVYDHVLSRFSYSFPADD